MKLNKNYQTIEKLQTRIERLQKLQKALCICDKCKANIEVDDVLYENAEFIDNELYCTDCIDEVIEEKERQENKDNDYYRQMVEDEMFMYRKNSY